MLTPAQVKDARQDIIRLLWRTEELLNSVGLRSIREFIFCLCKDGVSMSEPKLHEAPLPLRELSITSLETRRSGLGLICSDTAPTTDQEKSTVNRIKNQFNDISKTILEIYFIVHQLEFRGNGSAVSYSELQEAYKSLADTYSGEQEIINRLYDSNDLPRILDLYYQLLVHAGQLLQNFIPQQALLQGAINLLGTVKDYQILRFLKEDDLFGLQPIGSAVRAGKIQIALSTSQLTLKNFSEVQKFLAADLYIHACLTTEIQPRYLGRLAKRELVNWVIPFFSDSTTTILSQLTALRVLEFMGGKVEVLSKWDEWHQKFSSSPIETKLCQSARSLKKYWLKNISSTNQGLNVHLQNLLNTDYNFIA